MNSTATVDNLGIPPLAGVCTYERAALPGLGVERTTEFLKRCNYVLRRLHETATAHLAATPEWEVKCALGLHLWLDAEHCGAPPARVAEMREPPPPLGPARALGGPPAGASPRAASRRCTWTTCPTSAWARRSRSCCGQTAQ